MNTQFLVQDATTNGSAHVAILMGTLNGAAFLAEQLCSIYAQSHQDWTLYVADDGSEDATLEILIHTQGLWGVDKLHILHGPQQGFVANFLSLTCNQTLKGGFFAWCDQDDIWYTQKLARALNQLNTVTPAVPALYCGRTEMISESAVHMGYSPLFSKPPSFMNALVQSIAGGNTMVFNQTARALLAEAGVGVSVVSHDWWLYQLVSGVGGVVYYDAQPTVRYRQHNENLVGANATWTARIVRLRMVLRGRFREWNEHSIQGLELMRHRLIDQNKIVLDCFKKVRSQSLWRRIVNCQRAGLYRQTMLGNLGLALAIWLKKI